MGKSSEFDLNAALLDWRTQLRRSPEFRDEDLAELESHLRDAIAELQGKNLSEEEAFLIATHRVGSVEQLATEFEKINRNPMNKVIHGLVFLFFSIGCWFLWALLTMSQRFMKQILGSEHLPGFTRLCLELRPLFYALPVLALAWCLVVWLRKTESRNSWVGFLAITTSVIMLTLLPTMVALYLPMIHVFVSIAHK